jgi:hypothetical protein
VTRGGGRSLVLVLGWGRAENVRFRRQFLVGGSRWQAEGGRQDVRPVQCRIMN